METGPTGLHSSTKTPLAGLLQRIEAQISVPMVIRPPSFDHTIPVQIPIGYLESAPPPPEDLGLAREDSQFFTFDRERIASGILS